MKNGNETKSAAVALAVLCANTISDLDPKGHWSRDRLHLRPCHDCRGHCALCDLDWRNFGRAHVYPGGDASLEVAVLS